MRAPAIKVLAIVSLLTSAEGASAADVSGYVALTSDYVSRGVTQSDGHAALQLGVDLAGRNGWYLGGWVSTVDIQPAPDRERNVEVNYYAGWLMDAGDSWYVGANAVFYQYPDSRGPIDYDYVEFSLTSNFDDRLFIEYAYSPDYYGSGTSTHNVDLYAEHALSDAWLVSVGGGYYDVSDFTGRGYAYWQFGVTRLFERAGVDLRFHDTNRWVPAVSSPDRAEARVSLTLSLHF